MPENSWLAEKLLDSQEELRSINLAINLRSMYDLPNTQCGYVDTLPAVPNTEVHCDQQMYKSQQSGL